MLVESSALYAVTSLLFIGTYGAGNNISALFLPILGQTQVCAFVLESEMVPDLVPWRR